MVMRRVMPCLLLKGQGLVKTVRFKEPKYVGDPRIAVKIFNEREVDELVLLDISATPERRGPRLELIHEIVSEAFMPVAYGGGIRTIDDIREVLGVGIEKVVVCTAAFENPRLIAEAAEAFGSQSILVSIDFKKDLFGRYEVYTDGGRRNRSVDPVSAAVEMEKHGAGELFLSSIDRDGTMSGFDLGLVRGVTQAVTVPVIACGGAGSLHDLVEAVSVGGAAGVAAGSLFVYQGKHRAVLISYPDRAQLAEVLD